MKTTTIELDKPRTLRFDLNALCAIEDATGKSLSQAVSNTMSSIRLMLWAGLKHEDPGLTLEQVGAMINPADAGLMEAVTNAFKDSLPDSGGGSENPPAPPLA